MATDGKSPASPVRPPKGGPGSGWEFDPSAPWSEAEVIHAALTATGAGVVFDPPPQETIEHAATVVKEFLDFARKEDPPILSAQSVACCAVSVLYFEYLPVGKALGDLVAADKARAMAMGAVAAMLGDGAVLAGIAEPFVSPPGRITWVLLPHRFLAWAWRFLNPDEPAVGREHEAIRGLQKAGRIHPRVGDWHYLMAAKRAIELLDDYHTKEHGAPCNLRRPEEVLDEILATSGPDLLFRKVDGRYRVGPRAIKDRLRRRAYAQESRPRVGEDQEAPGAAGADATAACRAIDAGRIVEQLRARCDTRSRETADSKHLSAVRGHLWQLLTDQVSESEVARRGDCSQADVHRAWATERAWVLAGDSALAGTLEEFRPPEPHP